jgi:hypothetical protein
VRIALQQRQLDVRACDIQHGNMQEHGGDYM